MTTLLDEMRDVIVAAGFVSASQCFASEIPPDDKSDDPVVVLVSRSSTTTGHLMDPTEWTIRNVRVTYQSGEDYETFAEQLSLLAQALETWMESACQNSRLQYWTHGADAEANQMMDGQVTNDHSGTLVYEVCETTRR